MSDDTPESAEFIAGMKATIKTIEEVAGDGEYGKMLQGRLTYEAGKSVTAGKVQ